MNRGLRIIACLLALCLHDAAPVAGQTPRIGGPSMPTAVQAMIPCMGLTAPDQGQTTSAVGQATPTGQTTPMPAKQGATQPKREFRGGWIQVVNGQLQGLTTAEAQARLLAQVDALRAAGCNAVVFQVRPACDALYASALEPWSRYLTGTQGQAPTPYWDPLAFMVTACHERGMELHAWINPYRALTSLGHGLAAGHVAKEHPDWTVTYGNQLLLDPALAECRDHICRVVQDIVSRYDVDGIHLDDYFYPYPTAGTEYPDSASYARYGQGFASRADWRRDNVNRLIRQLHQTVRSTKPWVKLGVSPFGIYRNAGSDPDGSATQGLQDYDDLYADVLLWVKQGWVDYLIPQIYWQIGHPVADYATLVDWWARHAGGRPLYIGQSVMNTVQNADPDNPQSHQLRHKMRLQRAYPRQIQGSCQWYAAALADNPGNYRDVLAQEYHRYPALQPLYAHIDSIAPGRVSRLKATWTAEGYCLTWQAPRLPRSKSRSKSTTQGRARDGVHASPEGSNAQNPQQGPAALPLLTDEEKDLELSRATQYVVYRFDRQEPIRLDDPSHIVAITRQTQLLLPYQDGRTTWRYVVTALDRLHNESLPVTRRVKL